MFDYEKLLKDLLQNLIKDLLKEVIVYTLNDRTIFENILSNTTNFIIF